MTGDPSPDPDERRIDVEPPGFGGFYGIGLATVLISAAMVLPMALIGMFAAVFWHDFHVALRLLMGIAGAGASLALIWLPIHILTRATVWQTRIRVRPGGVFVEAGIPAPRSTWWLTPRADVQAAVSERGLGGIALSCGRRHIRMAAGHTPPAREQMLMAIQRAMTPRLGAGLAFVLSTFTAIGLHWSLLRRADTAAPAPTPNRTLDLARSLTLVPLCVLHEAGLLTFLVDSSRNLGPLGLAFVPALVLFGYLPLRLHAFVDDPGDRSNLAWFWITVAGLALQPLLSLGPAIAQKL